MLSRLGQARARDGAISLGVLALMVRYRIGVLCFEDGTWWPDWSGCDDDAATEALDAWEQPPEGWPTPEQAVAAAIAVVEQMRLEAGDGEEAG